ncbi:MAG: DUF2764 family protein [Bacteroidaceae bacterium]|nr:DUF2764 family protein [Bacteroidaceae bacterium]
MSNYYCLVAGLPELAFDGSKAPFTVEKFREEVYPFLKKEDARCIDLFFMAWDNANILLLLRDGADSLLERKGCYSKEQLLEIMAAAKEGDPRRSDVPEYMYDFLEYYYANEERTDILWEDNLALRYYAYAMKCGNKFISEWFDFNLNVNNILVAVLARKYKLNIETCVLGDGEVAEAIRTSGARDFGLTGVLDYLEMVIRISENDKLQERERMLDDMRWNWLDDNSVFDYFTVERLFVFLQKLDIIERWAVLDAEKGMQRYKELIDELKSGTASFIKDKEKNNL